MKTSSTLYRTCVLIGLEFAQRGKNYMWVSCLLIIGVLAMTLPTLYYDTYNHQCQLLQYAAIPMVLIFGSSFYSSTALSDYTAGNKGIFALMMPASMAEKMAAALLVNLIFLILFAALFWIMHFETMLFANTRIPTAHTKYSPVTRDVAMYLTYCYFLFNSVVFAGSIYFTKSSFVKTLACAILGAFALSSANTSFAKYLASYPMMMGAIPFGGWNVVQDSSLKVYKIHFPEMAYAWLYILPALMVFGFWFVAYKRLQEKQL
ncbi:hypothetical protein L0663_17535 [Dyadobacter sp. CY107]|uniref:hypothetical protein n=1 Tax=Dyadobacter fanqingshengii TaxID=2906443 RepID=UPI001F2D708C|nr:hypothetical protein [Dyadobacter fanqingshengii]MCF2505199.1 hypothetical protein [Dyadobacter fanqingshengii]